MENKYKKLLAAIETRITALSLELENESDKRVEYLDNFFEKYSIKNPATLLNIKPSELLLALLLEKERSVDADILISQVDEVKDYINNLNEDTMEKILDISCIEDEEEYLDNLEKNLTTICEGKDINNILANKISSMLLTRTVKNISKKINIEFDSYEDSLSFIKLVKILKRINKKNNYSILLFLLELHNSIPSIKVIFNTECDNNLGEIIDTVIGKTLNKEINNKRVEQSLDDLYSYYRQIDKETKAKDKLRNKKIYRYTELKSILEHENKKKEITSIDSILDKILDDDIKCLCLEYIHEHNMNYYSNLYQEYSYKSQNSINKYISFFETLNIDFMEIPEEIQAQIMNISLDDIKKKLKLLPKITIDNFTKIAILYKTSISVIEEINLLLKKGYIDLELLSNNLDIYYDETKFKNLKNNIELLKKENINIRELSSKNILLVDYDLIKENIKLLKDMNISIKGINNINMLSKTDLSNYIASLIEVNLEDILKLHPELLNSDNNLAKRIIIAKTIGEDVYENGTVKDTIIDKNNFFVSDGEINNYLFDRDNSKYHSNLIIELENSTDSSFSYDIEGVKIPKSRVSNLNISLDNIIKPSLYSKEEIKVLEKHSK